MSPSVWDNFMSRNRLTHFSGNVARNKITFQLMVWGFILTAIMAFFFVLDGLQARYDFWSINAKFLSNR